MTSKVEGGTAYWDDRRQRIRSSIGGWRMGKGVVCHGYDMLEELMGEVSYFQLMFLSVLGHVPERRLADWVEASFMCLSWPDPRIWCNQVGALAATARTSPVAATTAGILAADSDLYGSRPLLEGVRFISEACLQHQNGVSVATIVEQQLRAHRGKLNIMGYARPLAKGDERVAAMERVTKKLGYAQGAHLQLAFSISALLLERFGESININGYVSAFMADQGYTAEQVYRLSTLCVASGVMACYVDARQQPTNSFLPLRCDDIHYEGVALRALPGRGAID